MQGDKAKCEKVGCAVHTIPRIASSRAGDGVSLGTSNGLRERMPPVSFPRKRESIRAAAFLDPRWRGGDKKGIHSRSILLEALRQATSRAGLRTDATSDSRPDFSTPARGAGLRSK
jgi:hypothetical protein